MINTKLHRNDPLYMWLHKQDVLTLIKPGLKENKQFNVPWVYTQTLYEARCEQFHKIYFETLSPPRIHSFCRSCWKVVVRPKNIVQLFDLYEFQRELAVPCKCGYEARETVSGLYGGYFYCRSKEEGLERYQQARDWADTVDKDIPVILKRYCTEFELGPGSLGPSDKLPEQTEEEKRQEKLIDNIIINEGNHYDRIQPDYIKVHVMRRWIHWAYAAGDKAVFELTGGSPLFPKYVTYHDEDDNKNKRPARRKR